MELKKYKLADIAKIEISGVDKKTIEGNLSHPKPLFISSKIRSFPPRPY